MLSIHQILVLAGLAVFAGLFLRGVWLRTDEKQWKHQKRDDNVSPQDLDPYALSGAARESESANDGSGSSQSGHNG